MATWQEVNQWCRSSKNLKVDGSGEGAGFSVSVAWNDGRAQNTLIIRMQFSGVDCVAIRSMFMPVTNVESFLGALNHVAENSDLGQPYGMILSGGTIWLATALPLQDLHRSQFEFALSQILAGGDSVEQVLGMDLNR